MDLKTLASDPFILLKRNGDKVPFKGLLHKGSITSFDSVLQVNSVFQVENGDSVERILPVSRGERYLVQDAVLNSVWPSHAIYTIKVEKVSGSPITGIRSKH